eukprot:TRINITY_DN50422_c0_g1_i1.p1 TRINITY_DN50422_c0_g1~~TRINITY_DN50422_c0_g1_i1.p1  ORF type:complete len:302 (-),score=84.76 TRINITY_DN50422_c0_g1_i1:134-982(-)
MAEKGGTSVGASLEWYDARKPSAVATGASAKTTVKNSTPAQPARKQPVSSSQPPPPPPLAKPTPQEAPTANVTTTVEAESPPSVPEDIIPSAGWELEVLADEDIVVAEVPAPPPSQCPARTLDALEVKRSVDEAMKAKESLARQSIARAREEVLARKAALQRQHAEEELRLQEEERALASIEDELHKGGDKKERLKIEELRAAIENVGRDIFYMERDVSNKRIAMQRATDAYVDAEERLASRRAARQDLEKDMLDMILSVGRAKDDRLNGLLQRVPETVSMK